MAIPIIPENIVVHLGKPNEEARNINVPFIDYIKNVASSEIYPTWPENAIRANIYAQVSYALNRIYTEWYRSKGYDFDITNSTQYDQFFVEGRDVFDNISRIVDEVFNDYVVKQGSVEPYFTQYCNGTTSTCPGLSQWGTVDLANQGKLPYEILQNYYGNDINIVFNAPVEENIPSYPGYELKLGVEPSEEVRTIQIQLNRIARNYPAIPKIPLTDGVYNLETEAAVKKFQEIFNLTPNGIVDKATWYKIKYLYNSVKKLSELASEGISLLEAERIFSKDLREGDTGDIVKLVQYYLAVIGYFNDNIPLIEVDGVFGPETKNAVIAFQQEFGIDQTGIVDRNTWNKLKDVYAQTIATLPKKYDSYSSEFYPGQFLLKGSTGDDVTTLQTFLQTIGEKNANFPKVTVTGIFDNATETAVKNVQKKYFLPVNGVVGPITWTKIVALSKQ